MQFTVYFLTYGFDDDGNVSNFVVVHINIIVHIDEQVSANSLKARILRVSQ